MPMDMAAIGVLGSVPGQSRLAAVGCDDVWRLVLALRQCVDAADPLQAGAPWALRRGIEGWGLASQDAAEVVADPVRRTLRWRGCEPDRQADAILDLHLEHALSARAPGCVVAILGQSLDGFIATRNGDSRYINGKESLVHLHRLRALSDAVLVGIGTALADEPRLTTRHVAGPSPVRIVLDPRARLPHDSGLLHDGAAPTFVVRGSAEGAGEARLSDQAVEIRLPALHGSIAPRAVIEALAMRGLTRLLIEGGGVTVARFLEAGAIDRVQLAVSPLILGGGRPALPVTPALRLDHALRPVSRSFGLGGDVLFDLRFGCAAGDDADAREIC
jgi:diaminohydroxyphosphoribosylaminopyrimidine deaminase/5-amino-6-(5-phosphoribosylamino)uracil reductase